MRSLALMMMSFVCWAPVGLAAEADGSHAPMLDVTSGATVTDTITIASELSIADVGISVDLLHSAVDELVITITSPAGTTVTLLENPPCASIPEALLVTFASFGTHMCDKLDCGLGVHVGPEGDLSSLHGESSVGAWTIEVTDNSPAGSSGLFSSWSLRLSDLPRNDTCDGARNVRAGYLSDVQFDTTLATASGVFPPCSAAPQVDLWYRVVPNRDGFLAFSTCGSSYAAPLAVWDGRFGCDNMTLLGCTDDVCNNGFDVEVSVSVEVEMVIYVQVMERAGSVGPGLLTLSNSTGISPSNDDCIDAEPVQLGVPRRCSTFAQPDGTTSCSTGGPIQDSWFSVTTPDEGVVEVYTAFDDDFCAQDLIEIAVWPGASCPSTGEIPLACHRAIDRDSILIIPVDAGNSYLIQLAQSVSAPHGAALLIAEYSPGFENDRCVNASDIVGPITSFSTVGASSGGTEVPCGPPISRDRWYRYTATCSGSLAAYVTETDSGADYDPAVVVWPDVGCPVQGDQALACETANMFQRASVYMPVQVGDSFLLQVGADHPTQNGAGDLHVECLAPVLNDSCANATEIASPETTFTTSGATATGLNSCPYSDSEPALDIWFRATASCDGVLRLWLSNEDFIGAPRLSAWRNQCPQLGVLTPYCDFGFGSALNIPVMDGDLVFLQISGSSGTSHGSGLLHFACTPALDNDSCAEAEDISGPQTLFSTVGATSDGVTQLCSGSLPIDTWYAVTAACDGVLRVTVVDEDYESVVALWPGSSGCPSPGALALDCARVEDRDAYAPVSAGQEVLIQVTGSFNGEQGSGVLEVECIPLAAGDSCFEPEPIVGSMISFDTTDAIPSGVNPDCMSSPLISYAAQAMRDLWFSVTTSCSGQLRISVPDSGGFPAHFAIWPGDGCPDLGESPIACTHWSTETLLVEVEVGEEYYIQLGGRFRETGTGDLFVACDPYFRRGDANGDAAFDIADAVALLAALFSGGPFPSCADAADANDSGGVDVADAVTTLAALFGGGAAIPSPGSATCGIDPTADLLDCVLSACP